MADSLGLKMMTWPVLNLERCLNGKRFQKSIQYGLILKNMFMCIKMSGKDQTHSI